MPGSFAAGAWAPQALAGGGAAGGSGGGAPGAEAAAMETLLRDRLGHFKLAKDAYNTHFYAMFVDHQLAERGLLRGGGPGGLEMGKGDLVFYVGNGVHPPRLRPRNVCAPSTRARS